MDRQASVDRVGWLRFANGPDRGIGDRSPGPGYRHVRRGSGVARCGFVVLLLIPLVSSGCMTSALWDSVDPDKRVWVPASKTTEEQLRKKGLSYEKHRFTSKQLGDNGIVCDDEVVEGFLVEKSDLQKFGDTLVLIAATPFTLAADVCCGVVLLTASDPYALGSLLHCALH